VGAIPYGTRFRLKSSFNITGFSAEAQVLLTQLKQYGTIAADGGSNFDIQTMTDVTQDAVVMAAFSEVGNSVQATDFEIVDESALRVSDLSGEVRNDNGYVPPGDYAVIVATNTANPSEKTQVSVILQGVTVSVPETALWIQSGVSRQLTAWVNGASTTSVSWSMNPPLGTLTSGGLYTTPQVSAPASTTITATSDANATARATIKVTVMPSGPIRIDVGSSNDYVDSKGNTWWRDQASESGFSVSNDCSYAGQNPWPSVPDIGLYYTQRYSLSDWSYRFVVPNGNYRITGMFAECGAAAPSTQRLLHVEANGQVVRYNL
jgi:Di-glucose binding within endoplasmic reticulum.